MLPTSKTVGVFNSSLQASAPLDCTVTYRMDLFCVLPVLYCVFAGLQAALVKNAGRSICTGCTDYLHTYGG